MALENKAYKATIKCTMLVQGTNDEPLEIEEYINAIRVDKQFFEASFPVYSFDMNVTGDIFKTIQDNDTFFNLKVSIRNVIYDEEEEERTLIDNILIPYEKPLDLINYDNPEDELGQEETENTSIPRYPLTIHLLSKNDYDKNKSIVNEVMSNIRPKEALLYIIGKAFNDSTKELFVEPVDNNERYKNIIIPPMNLVPAVNYIQKTYGVYDTGIKLFIDGGNMYLLRKNGQLRINDVLKRNISIIFTSENGLSTDHNGVAGIKIEQDSSNIEIVTISEPIISNIGDTNSQLAGQNIIFGKYSELFDIDRVVVQNDESDDSLKTKYYWNSFNNPIFEREFINEINQTSTVVSFIWNEIDPYYFNIMNNYFIDTNNEDLNGLYRIQHLNYSLVSPNTDNDFDIVGKSTFTKV